jgi:DNA-binding transcriptional LysR family regulator
LVIDAEDAETALVQLQETPRGLLKISAPVIFGVSHLCDVLPQFLIEYPNIDLVVDYNERNVDVVAEGFDVALQLGPIKDSNLIAKKIMDSTGAYVASPKYLEERGIPSTPKDLDNHECISFSLSNEIIPWEFRESNGKTTVINVKPRVSCNSAELEVSMAEAGLGIAGIPIICCETALEGGKLVKIFKDYQVTDFGIYALYPHRQLLSAKVRAFVDFLCVHFSS